MKRKIVKQGNGGFTVTLPVKWIRDQEIKAGDEVDIIEEEKKLVLSSAAINKKPKSITISLEPGDYNQYRSLIGGLYRAGYDQIKVQFKDAKVLPVLQEVIDSLYGFEVLDVGKNSCIIHSIYREETPEIESHIQKIINIISTIQATITEDVNSGRFESESQLCQFRNNILKQRDLIARVIVQQKLLDNKHFPYYLLSFNLWNIARNYYDLYLALEKKKQMSKKQRDIITKINLFVQSFLKQLREVDHAVIDKQYRKLAIEVRQQLMKSEKNSLVTAYCLNILMLVQSSISPALQLRF